MLIVWWVALVLNLVFWIIVCGLPDIAAGQMPSASAIAWAVISCVGFIKFYPLAKRYDEMGRS